MGVNYHVDARGTLVLNCWTLFPVPQIVSKSLVFKKSIFARQDQKVSKQYSKLYMQKLWWYLTNRLWLIWCFFSTDARRKYYISINRWYFSCSSRGWKPKISLLVDLMFSEASVFVLQVAVTCLPCLYKILLLHGDISGTFVYTQFYLLDRILATSSPI